MLSTVLEYLLKAYLSKLPLPSQFGSDKLGDNVLDLNVYQLISKVELREEQRNHIPNFLFATILHIYHADLSHFSV
jgi:hypothetical protein